MPRGGTTANEKGYTARERGKGKDRFDTSAVSLSNNVIWMPAKHHRLSLAARRST
jgi:hypothetical protein